MKSWVWVFLFLIFNISSTTGQSPLATVQNYEVSFIVSSKSKAVEKVRKKVKVHKGRQLAGNTDRFL
ncbi:MAG: hypothetical protein IPL46_10285 [Saprospiraceae bacterium]|nr:hypothetical protein [Saprospiraceae bacterium]